MLNAFTKKDVSENFIYELRTGTIALFSPIRQTFYSCADGKDVAFLKDYDENLLNFEYEYDIVRVYENKKNGRFGAVVFERNNMDDEYRDGTKLKPITNTNDEGHMRKIYLNNEPDPVKAAIENIRTEFCDEVAEAHKTDNDITFVCMWINSESRNMGFRTFGDNDDIMNLAMSLIENHVRNEASSPEARIMIMMATIRAMMEIENTFERECAEEKRKRDNDNA